MKCVCREEGEGEAKEAGEGGRKEELEKERRRGSNDFQAISMCTLVCSMHLEVSNPVSNILVAGGLLIGQFDSFADCTQERLATHSEVSRTIDNHLQTLNLKE